MKIKGYLIWLFFLLYPLVNALAQTEDYDVLYTPRKQQVTRDIESVRRGERDRNATAQPRGNYKRWTLEECIQYAIEHNISIQRLKVQQKVAAVRQNTAENSRWPDLNAAVMQDWSFGRSQTYADMDEPLSGTRLGASASIPLFTGFRIPNEIARTKLEFEAATQNLEKVKDDLSIHITALFLQVLFCKELVKVNEDHWLLTQNQLKKTILLIEAGSVPSVSLYDVEAQLAKDKVSVIEAQNNLELALLDLAQALELERESQFDIKAPAFSEKLMGDMFRKIMPAQLIFEHALTGKPVIKEQEYKVASAKKMLKVTQAGYMPNLNLVFEWGTGYLYRYDGQDVVNPSTGQLVKANGAFGNQLKNNDYMLIGLKLSIPVFNRFETRNKVRAAKLDIADRELALEDAKKILYKEIQVAHKNVTAAHEKYKASNDAVTFTSESFRHAQIRYELAKLTSFEYDEVKTRFLQSQSEQIQAKYDYILRAKILDFYNGIPVKL
ncbi:MAG: TolC family protein [Tannerellaceae bacterium]|jgi:outer membrane protein|nr:TolC family protein [Tannerellaceae bacterium]